MDYVESYHERCVGMVTIGGAVLAEGRALSVGLVLAEGIEKISEGLDGWGFADFC